ncbi:hypothetical protein N7478_004767 [Penicillium angulare]|uniref:uncharacterized protein n=1 Tax=Penicillium angulare TaxID=116970 RepID=UPI0025416C21|nr:uncharacterized protein N7478_004767 [Penicillium angulare]KAJ5279395.1 hypothetical protein N7478_004767 [Penicillium angulare]
MVVIRTHVQYKSSKRLFMNDYWIFFAIICHLATAIVYQVALDPMYELSYIGAGLKSPTAGFMDRASLFLKLQYAADLLLWTTLWAVKFSLLFFFWRLFDSVNSSMRVFWWIMCGVTASTWITSIVLQEFACDPISDFFTLVMVIPFPLLYKLKVNRQKRWILILVFSLPIIPIIFAILRLVMTNPKTHNVDPIRFQLFTILENTSAIVTSCLPAFRLFIVNTQRTTITSDSDPSRRINGAYRSFGDSSRNRQKTSIPLDSFSDSYYQADIVHDKDAIGRAISKESDEESLYPGSPTTPTHGVLVTRETHVVSKPDGFI